MPSSTETSDDRDSRPRLVVFASLFPSPARPTAGSFIRERMFRVARRLPLVVVSPQPWFPLQGLIRRFVPHYRPPAPRLERQQGITVYRPRFLAVPGLFRGLDGLSMALAAWPLLRRLRRDPGVDLLDAHFAYPDGYAATRLGRWLGLPVTITLRGTEVPQSRQGLSRQILRALADADRVIAVADALKRHVTGLGADPAKITVIGNGVDLQRFRPEDQRLARQRLGLPEKARLLVTVGGLVERKGFHRVIDCLPALLAEFPELHYLVVGGGGAEGDWEGRLRAQVAELGVESRVHFLGPVAPDELRWPLSAADLFVLATRNEGWANVFLEAMACGLPVVTTDVGGNREVVCDTQLGTVVPFGDAAALTEALRAALARDWDRAAIRAHAEANGWDGRVATLCGIFTELYRARQGAGPGLPAGEAR
ncbi:glycosyltransferase [Thiohalobacter sp. IOR34]|uniref:glycosyltransferase n=1 Tax=Thiohalobacter sp. IOR34 TaxID=3057176 RepID=UPI0025B1688E|nr:glycosyltransferase [Thiohalobacter sp. IOR34]WJW74454.1 glycosyltransferase [Thiohalobacter sp. IOR34]